jgi:hypothetical protein
VDGGRRMPAERGAKRPVKPLSLKYLISCRSSAIPHRPSERGAAPFRGSRQVAASPPVSINGRREGHSRSNKRRKNRALPPSMRREHPDHQLADLPRSMGLEVREATAPSRPNPRRSGPQPPIRRGVGQRPVCFDTIAAKRGPAPRHGSPVGVSCEPFPYPLPVSIGAGSDRTAIAGDHGFMHHPGTTDLPAPCKDTVLKPQARPRSRR